MTDMESPAPSAESRMRPEHVQESAGRLPQLLAEICARLSARPADWEDWPLNGALRLICEELAMDRVTLWQTTEAGNTLAATHCWQRPEFPPPPPMEPAADAVPPWIRAMLETCESFHFPQLEALSAAEGSAHADPHVQGLLSVAAFPMIADGKPFGALACGMITTERYWTDNEIFGLEIVARVCGQLVGGRCQAGDAERRQMETKAPRRSRVPGEFATALAHEMNQPLAAILGNAQAARRFITSGDISRNELLAILDDIIRDDKRASAIIRNLQAHRPDSP